MNAEIGWEQVDMVHSVSDRVDCTVMVSQYLEANLEEWVEGVQEISYHFHSVDEALGE